MLVSKRSLRAIAPVTDPKSARYALGSVLVERNGAAVHVVATDGRVLVALEQPQDDKAQEAIVRGTENKLSTMRF